MTRVLFIAVLLVGLTYPHAGQVAAVNSHVNGLEDMPLELLEKVAKRIDNVHDLLQFKSTSKRLSQAVPTLPGGKKCQPFSEYLRISQRQKTAIFIPDVFESYLDRLLPPNERIDGDDVFQFIDLNARFKLFQQCINQLAKDGYRTKGFNVEDANVFQENAAERLSHLTKEQVWFLQRDLHLLNIEPNPYSMLVKSVYDTPDLNDTSLGLTLLQAKEPADWTLHSALASRLIPTRRVHQPHQQNQPSNSMFNRRFYVVHNETEFVSRSQDLIDALTAAKQRRPLILGHVAICMNFFGLATAAMTADNEKVLEFLLHDRTQSFQCACKSKYIQFMNSAVFVRPHVDEYFRRIGCP